MSVEFLSGNRRLAYPLARHGTGGFDVSRLLVDASVACDCDTGSTPWLHAVYFDSSGVTFVVCAARSRDDAPQDRQYLHLTVSDPDARTGKWARVFGHEDQADELGVSVCATLVVDVAALHDFIGWSREHGNPTLVEDIPFCARCVGFGRPRVERIEVVTRTETKDGVTRPLCGSEAPLVPYFLT